MSVINGFRNFFHAWEGQEIDCAMYTPHLCASDELSESSEEEEYISDEEDWGSEDLEEEDTSMAAAGVDDTKMSSIFQEESNGQDKLPTDQALKVARRAGAAPDRAAESKLREIGDEVNQSQLREWCRNNCANRDTVQLLSAMFKFVDHDADGYITTQQFHHVLTQLGSSDALSAQEYDALVRAFDIKAPQVNYASVCEEMLSG